MASIGRIRNVRRLGDSKGANLVEAAIITPLLLLLTFTIVDFAAMFYCYLALEHGVSQATRFAVTGQQMSSGGAPIGREASIKTAMRDATPTLTIPDSAFSFSFMAMNGTSWASGLGGAERRRPRHCQLQLAVHDAAGSAVLHQRAAQPARAINHEERDAVPMTRPTHRTTHTAPLRARPEHRRVRDRHAAADPGLRSASSRRRSRCSTSTS